MAISFVALGARAWVLSNNDDATVSIPACQEGDLLVLHIDQYTGPQHFNPVIPAGWTLRHLQGSNGPYQSIWTKFATAAEAAGTTFTVQHNGGGDAIWALHYVSAFRSVSGIGDVAFQRSTNNSSVVSPVVSAGASDVVLSSFAGNNDSNPSISGATSVVWNFTNTQNWSARLAGTLDPNGGVTFNLGFACSAVSMTLKGNQPPNAATLTTLAGGEKVNRLVENVAQHSFSDPDAGDSQSKADHRWRVVGAGTWSTETVTVGQHPSCAKTFAAGSLAAGDYERQVLPYDNQGVPAGSWTSSGFFTVGEPPIDPAILAPSNGATISTEYAVVEWSANGEPQEAYQARLLDTADVLVPGTDTGQINSVTARSRTMHYADNGVTRKTQVRILGDGFWSSWATVSNPVSYTPPPTPTRTLTADDLTGSITVAIANPAPSGDEPAVAYNDVYVSDPGKAEERRADNVPANGTWVYWTPVGGHDYEPDIRVVAVGDNGVTSSS